MQRTVFILSAVVSAATFVFPGAILGKGPTEIGLKAGLNIADYRGYWKDTDSKLGFCGGAFIAHSINEVFAVQTEFLFSMKGASLGKLTRIDESGHVIGTSSVREVLYYLEIPVLGRFSVLPQSRLRPNLFAGPFFALKLAGMNELGSEETDMEHLKDTDYGSVVGAGVDLELGPGELVVEARYALGWAAIYHSGMLDESVRNRVISVMLGYSF